MQQKWFVLFILLFILDMSIHQFFISPFLMDWLMDTDRVKLAHWIQIEYRIYTSAYSAVIILWNHLFILKLLLFQWNLYYKPNRELIAFNLKKITTFILCKLSTQIWRREFVENYSLNRPFPIWILSIIKFFLSFSHLKLDGATRMGKLDAK